MILLRRIAGAPRTRSASLHKLIPKEGARKEQFMERSSIKRSLLIFSVAFLMAVTGALAQTGTSSLHGVVTDKTGAIIVGAKVSLSNQALGLQRELSTGSSGEYEFHGLPPGTYVLSVVMVNFRKYEQKNLQLLVNSPATANVTLEVGTASQTVEVSAQTETLNTTDASLGNAFNETQVKELPLEGRNVPDLLSLQAGVVFTSNRPDINANTFDTRSGAVNGARSDQSNVTIDGIAVNDEGGHAFTSVLPVTPDSVQEFRVTTTNYNADQGSSSGAQVALVTKSGTNSFHGSAYEYNRNTYTSANDYFVKHSQLLNGEPNKAPKLIRNVFGASLGGPFIKDRFYFFLNFEGTRRVEEQAQQSVVPTGSLRDGVIFYQCDHTSATVATDCPGGSVTGKSGAAYAIPAPITNSDGSITAYNALSPQQITQMDPLHLGPSPVMLTYLSAKNWPLPNNTGGGDGFNYSNFTFRAPVKNTKNWYIGRLDYNITRDAKQRVGVSGALANENLGDAPFLPGQASEHTTVNFNKGIIANYSGVISQSLVNNFRYGFIRESLGIIGNSSKQWIFFRGLNDQTGAVTRTRSFQRPIHNFTDDLSWIRGRHTLQFGGTIDFMRNPRSSFSSSFSDGSANASWTNYSGFAGKPKSPLNPANNPSGAAPCNPATGVGCLPGVDSGFANAYDFPLTALLGMVSEVDAQYNYQRNGSPLAQGTPLQRRFAQDGYEMYAQDSWKVKPSFTLTLGLRYSLFSPIWETSGLQVSPVTSMSQFVHQRQVNMNQGIPSNQDPLVAFNWSGPANGGKKGFYGWDHNDFGPRVAFAWSPKSDKGLFRSLFGDGGKTSIRAGFGIVFDRFGQGLVDAFDRSGSFGLSSGLSNPAGFETASSTPRLTDVNTIPVKDNNGTTIFLPAPAANFPQPFPTGTFNIGWSLDDALKTPYSYAIDFSVGRELRGGFSLQVSYVGRLSHRLLNQQDLGMPMDTFDKKAGIDYFKAVTELAKLYRSASRGGQGVSSGTFTDSMVSSAVVQYWQDMIQPVQPGGAYTLGLSGGCGGPASTTDPVLMAFDLFCGGSLNETTPLQTLDYFGIPDANGLTDSSGNPITYFPKGGRFTFYNPQYAALFGWRSTSAANYHAMQVNLQHQMRHGFQFDFNYTFSKSIDLASDAERVLSYGGLGDQVINTWDPNAGRAVSTFDATHQFNANGIWELPFGKGKRLAGNANRGLDAVIGGWQLSGLFRMTSGFPLTIGNGFNWATNWNLSGNTFKQGTVKAGVYAINSGPDAGNISIFADGPGAYPQFRPPFPGESGARNQIRGGGYFGVDLGLAKRWTMPWSEKQKLQLRWEVFNVTNSVSFNSQSVNSFIDVYGNSFGNYTNLLTNPRVMQFALRFEF
jgi:hypothetical protein